MYHVDITTNIHTKSRLTHFPEWTLVFRLFDNIFSTYSGVGFKLQAGLLLVDSMHLSTNSCFCVLPSTSASCATSPCLSRCMLSADIAAWSMMKRTTYCSSKTRELVSHSSFMFLMHQVSLLWPCFACGCVVSDKPSQLASKMATAVACLCTPAWPDEAHLLQSSLSNFLHLD